MMSTVYFIAHGDRHYDTDPLMNDVGIGQILALVPPDNISMVVHGTGRLFYQIYEILKNRLPAGIPVNPSIYCGSADGLEKDGSIILTNSVTATQDNYYGLVHGVKNGYLDLKKFLQSLPDNALICGGGEFLIALCGISPPKGRMYKLDPMTG